MLGKDLISLRLLEAQDFHDLLAVAALLKRRRALGQRDESLNGKTLAMIFEKPSLRTRVSFEVGMTELGGRAMYLTGQEIGLNVREPVQDVARVLSRFVQGIMIRTFAHQNVVDLARYAGIPVINGLCDTYHPCQALADFLTMQEHFGRLRGLEVVFIGDANNVSRSLAWAAIHAGARLTLACPKSYAFHQDDIAAFGAHWGSAVRQVHDPREAVRGAHVLYSDVWTSMGQEAEREVRLQAFQGYQINRVLLAQAHRDCKVMHCLPAHRGEEVTDEAFESEASIVFDQAENRMHAQKAVLRLLMAADRAEVIALAREGV